MGSRFDPPPDKTSYHSISPRKSSSEMVFNRARRHLAVSHDTWTHLTAGASPSPKFIDLFDVDTADVVNVHTEMTAYVFACETPTADQKIPSSLARETVVAAAATVVTGLCRRRRTLSKRLTFIDLEPSSSLSSEHDGPIVGSAEPNPTDLIQLVCEWRVPACVVSGMRIQAKGSWEGRRAFTINLERDDNGGEIELTGRFAVTTDDIEILEDCRGQTAWHNAAEGAAWRARKRQQNIIGGSCNAGSAQGNRMDTVMCLSWADFGKCDDPSCTARHAAETQWERRRCKRADARRKLRNSECVCPHGGSSANASKSKHNLVFAQWLVDTFGIDALVGGSDGGAGVIDIAGGRGMLALELALSYNVPSVTLLEPKPLRLNKAYQRRVKKWRRHRMEVRERYEEDDGDTVVYADTLSLFDGNGHGLLMNRIEDKLGKDVKEEELHENEGGETLEVIGEISNFNEQETVLWTPITHESVAHSRGAGNETELLPVQHIQAEFHGLTDSTDDVVAAVRAAGTIVGMHPDAPTGYIVDAALELGKPFAVVPCCVFAQMFPDRRTPDGRPVSTYEDLLDYLQAKSPDIERAELECEGRRVVLFRRNLKKTQTVQMLD